MEDERLHLQSDNWKERYGDIENPADIALLKGRETFDASTAQDLMQHQNSSWVHDDEVNLDSVLGKAKSAAINSARSTCSLGSVVGRGAQAEKLRVRHVEQGLRSKLLSMVPGRNELQKAFKLFDFGADGKIDALEFQRLFKRLNIPLSDDETRLLFNKYDKDGSGSVEYWEFVNKFLPPDTDYNWRDFSSMGRIGFARVHPDLRVHKMVDILSNEVGKERLGQLYDKVVENAEGDPCFRNGQPALSHLQFTQGMEKSGFQLSSEQWMHMFLVADDDKSGMLDKQEFIELFGTERGKHIMLNGPGGETGNCYNPFTDWREKMNAEPAVYLRTQLNLPGCTVPKAEGEVAGRNPLDEDLTTCTDALAHLKLAFKHQRVSMDKFFEQFDEAPSNGWISRKELDVGLRKFGLELSDTEICHLVRCMGVREYEEGITKQQFAQIVTDDTVDSYDNIRGDVNDGRSKSKLGQTLSMPKGIQPNNGDPIRTARGSVDWCRVDPDHRASESRNGILAADGMSNTLKPRRTQDLPAHLRTDSTKRDMLRSALDKISCWVEEAGVGGAFSRLDRNQNQFVTADDLCSVIQGLSARDGQELADFLDHNQDGAISLKDFSASVREMAKGLPQLAPSGDFTRTGSTSSSFLKTIPSRTRYCHDWIADYSLHVPSRYKGRRRAHDHPDGVVGASTQGVAGAIIPRCDSPAFLSCKERHTVKAPEWVAGTMGKVQGWQQEMIVADNLARTALNRGRQSRLQLFQGTAAATCESNSNRARERASVTQDLKKLQKTRYMRTVCAEDYE